MINEYDIEVEGIPVHCYAAGSGFPILFFHGSGAGVGTMSNFRNVIPELSETYRVVGADLIGFGKSGLKQAPPFFDVDLWVRQVVAVIDHCEAEAVALVGHSLSGPIVLKAAARDRRVVAVFTTGTMGTSSEHVQQGPRWRLPESRDDVQAAIERTMYNPEKATDDEVERRLAVLNSPGYAEYFTSMFGDNNARYVDDSALTNDELASITCPVVLLHGRHDRSFAPQETSLPLGESLPDADVVVLARCAHSVAHERPDIFIGAVRATLRTLSK